MMRDRRLETARRKLHERLKLLAWHDQDHQTHAHNGYCCPDACKEGTMSRARIRMLREIIREFGGRA